MQSPYLEISIGVITYLVSKLLLLYSVNSVPSTICANICCDRHDDQ
jgi:hypothetical protein